MVGSTSAALAIKLIKPPGAKLYPIKIKTPNYKYVYLTNICLQINLFLRLNVKPMSGNAMLYLPL